MSENNKTATFNPFVSMVNISFLLESSLEQASKKQTDFLGTKTCVYTKHKNFETYAFNGIELPEMLKGMKGTITFVVTDEKQSPVIRLSLTNDKGDMLLSTVECILHPSANKQIKKIYEYYSTKNA